MNASMRRLATPLGATVLAGLLLAACSTGSATEPVETNQVNLPPSYRFDPDAIAVEPGTVVTWTNNDNFTHNVRLLDDGGQVLPLPPGESVSFTFEQLGEYRYDCSLHPTDMRGLVVVRSD